LPRLKQQRIVHSARDVFSLEVAPRRSWLVRFYPLMPCRPPEALSGFARQGRGKEAARFSQGLGCPFEKTPLKSEERRINAAWGGFFFGYFLLAENCSCIFGIRHIPVACHAKESIAAAGPRTGVKSVG
jgi:hypothetical protein